MTKKRLLLGGVVVIIIGLIVFAAVLRGHTKNTKQPPTLTITNASVLSSIDQKDLSGVKKTLLQKVVATTQNHDNVSYQATVRRGSLKTTYNLLDGIKTPNYYFVVDIPEAKRTFQVAFSGGDGYAISILYVLCPKPSQLIYPAFACQDVGV